MRDREAREYAATSRTETLLVEAGAGTGKTTLLITRILNLIEVGVDIERIAAVTFTVKAAGDLKKRLREKLQEHGGSARAQVALQNIDRMTVGTIHALAGEMLRTLPVEAKLPPEFAALDELEQRAFRDEFFTDWLNRALDGDTPHAFELAEDIGLELLSAKSGGLRDLLAKLVEQQIDAVAAVTANQRTVCDALTDFRYAIRNALSQCANCKAEDDKLLANIDALRNVERTIPDSIFTADGISWLKSVSIGRNDRGAKEKWLSAEALSAAREALADVKVAVQSVKLAVTDAIVAEIVRWLAPAVTEYRKTLLEQGAVGFDDLLVCCRNMLRDSHIARSYFKRRYKHVHIDEFQDTDPIQIEIAFYLCEQENEFASDWREVNLAPGKLFIVGDPKQSIYRFRGADIAAYGDVANRIAACGSVKVISTNFRSSPLIVNEVNATFESVFDGGSNHVPKHAALDPDDKLPFDAASVELLLPPPAYSRGEQNARDGMRAEAAAIADHILKSRKQAMPLGTDAVLLRKGTHLGSLLDEFSARGIDFVSFMNSAFAERVEVEAIRTILMALDQPHNTMATIGALRSPWFALSDDDLYAHKLTGASFNYTDGHSGDSRVSAALRELLRWHTDSRLLPPSLLLERLLMAFPFDLIYGMKSDGVQRVQNIRAVVEIVRKLEFRGAASLGSVVDALEKMDKLTQASELEARESNDGAVQIMTIHKSKGLEFDSVYLFGVSDSEKSDSGWWVERGSVTTPPQIAICGDHSFATSNRESLKKLNAMADEAERNRLWYVAMTRAKQKLVVPLGWRRAKKVANADIPATLARRFWNLEVNAVAEGTHAARVVISDALPVEGFKPYAAAAHFAEQATGGSAGVFADWQRSRQTRIEHLTAAAQQPTKEAKAVAWSQVRARRVGTFVHTALDKLAHGAVLSDALEAAARAVPLSPDESEEATNLIATAADSALFRTELPQARQVFTELPIYSPDEDAAQQHIADLLFQNAQGDWILLDYKTDHLPAEALPARAQELKKQLVRYADLITQVVGSAPAEMRLYFLRANVVHRVD